MVLTNVVAEPLWEDVGAQLDEGERKIGQQEAGDVTHETFSVQISQFGQETVDNQGECHEHGRQEHSNGKHGEHNRVHHAVVGVGVGETEQWQNCPFV